jgi:general secretion pathway protein B
MSYILEALRRAERERAQGQLPAAEAGGTPTPAPPRSPMLPIVVVLLAIMVVVLLVLLLRPKAEPMTASTPLARIAAAPSPIRTETPAIAPAELEEPIVEQGVASMDDLGAGDTEEVPAETDAPRPRQEHQLPRGQVTFAKKPLTAAKPPPPPDPENDYVEEDVAEPVEPSPPAPRPLAGEGSAPALGEGASAKPLADMPAAYQAAFPAFKMEVHVFDAQPQRRFAIIGGQRYREGDALPQGARLVQIVPEGLVLDFGNERVLYPIGRH